MPAPRKTNGAKPRAAAATDTAPPSHEAIAHRAYELFLQRGGAHGSDRDDWLVAERELMPRPAPAARRAPRRRTHVG